jgi:hypothetical protein
MLLADGSARWKPGFGVQRNPIVRIIFWGPRWKHDPTGIISGVETLFHELPDSAWGSVLQQYGVNDDTRLAGVLIDPSRPPRRHPLTLQDTAREVDRARTRLHAGSGGQWIVLPESGTNITKFSEECGEHDPLQSRRRRLTRGVMRG